MKVVRAEREAEKQRWETQRRQKEAIEQRVRTQHARINTFTELFTQWRRANDCRAFIDALLSAPVYQELNRPGFTRQSLFFHQEVGFVFIL